jgi:hypothetical protein
MCIQSAMPFGQNATANRMYFELNSEQALIRSCLVTETGRSGSDEPQDLDSWPARAEYYRLFSNSFSLRSKSVRGLKE